MSTDEEVCDSQPALAPTHRPVVYSGEKDTLAQTPAVDNGGWVRRKRTPLNVLATKPPVSAGKQVTAPESEKENQAMEM